MEKEVVYDLRLRDGLTKGVDGANSAVNRLESSLGNVQGLLAGIGIGMAAFKGAEFIHQANEDWDKMEFAISQVESVLLSTKQAAGLTFDDLRKGAQETAHELKFTQAEIMGMQSLLLTFPSIAKDNFGKASNIIADMSTRLGQDLKSSAIQVGKALQDPEHGITALRRVGVNFNDEQTKVIKNLVATNQVAKAQALILNELSFEFGGAALAAAEADKSFRLDKTMEENRLQLGEMVDQLKEKLMPTLLSVAKQFGNLLDWVSKNKHEIKEWGLAIGSAILAFEGMAVIPPILLAVENALVAAATSSVTFGTALNVALGSTLALAGAVGLLVLALQKYQTSTDVKDQYLAAVTADEQDFVNQGMEKYKGKKDAYELAIKDEESALNTSQQNITAALKKELDIRDGLRKKSKGSVESLDYEEKQALAMASENVGTMQNDLLKITTRQSALEGIKKAGLVPDKTGKPEGVTAPVETPKTKATGSKSVTINVTIQKLTGIESLNTTNLKESTQKIKEAVTAVMISAVNDFQVTAGNS